MSIPSVLKATAFALAIATGSSLFAQGTPINTAAFDALVAQGPVADAATIASWPNPEIRHELDDAFTAATKRRHAPSFAMYWHIGDMTIRLASVTDRSGSASESAERWRE